jgi:hypothetical protein
MLKISDIAVGSIYITNPPEELQNNYPEQLYHLV